MSQKLTKFRNEFRRTMKVSTRIALGSIFLIVIAIAHAAISLASGIQDAQVFGTIASAAYIAIALIGLRIVWCPEDTLLPAKTPRE